MKLTLLLLLAAVLPKAKVPFVVADGNGGFYVSHVGANGAFQVAQIRDGKWSPARTISGDANLLVNSADYPSIALVENGKGKRLLASWSTRNGHGTVIHLAESRDGGATWSKATTPHPRDGTMGAPMRVAAAGGFPRMAVSKENVGVVWAADDGVHFQLLEGVK
ncbi:MAG TPA: sialidase family protein [Thermoanaerobaculia bacterium]|nr:sialidase family protein [Thermoanaerobaculia bacterium]